MEAIIPKIPLSSLLSLTKAHFCSHYHPPLRYNNILVGAVLFQPSTAGAHKLLLLKRAAHDPAFLNLFAIPGGHVEDNDQSILHSLKRELFEETTMLVGDVVDQIESLVWVTEKSIEGEGVSLVKKFTSLQLNFVCDVEGWAFRVDPEEHSVGVWADREEMEKLEMSTGMRKVVDNAFRWKAAVVKRSTKL